MVLLDLSSARRKQREEPVTAKELAGLRGLLGQLMWLATQVVPQLQAPLSLLLGFLGVATVSTLLEANKLARRALVWAQTPLRTFVHEEMSVIGWSDASWACRREGSSQGRYIIGVANQDTRGTSKESCQGDQLANWPEWQGVTILQSCRQQPTLKENSVTSAFP